MASRPWAFAHAVCSACNGLRLTFSAPEAFLPPTSFPDAAAQLCPHSHLTLCLLIPQAVVKLHCPLHLMLRLQHQSLAPRSPPPGLLSLSQGALTAWPPPVCRAWILKDWPRSGRWTLHLPHCFLVYNLSHLLQLANSQDSGQHLPQEALHDCHRA